MKAVRDKLKSLMENGLNYSGLYWFYVEERNDEVGYEQAVEDIRLQWVNSVAAILDIAHQDELLRIWREVTSTRGNEDEYKVVLAQIIEELYNESLPKPHKDMPASVREDYEEAQDVFPYSARSAAALLRLALQKLCKELGEKGKNINADIGSLVKKGLSEHIQQALDIMRVVGNEAVHPGVINIRDNPEIAMELFSLINEIVEDQIAMKQRIKARYDSLPPNKLKGIEDRDAKK
jgi:hypothetical protein